MKSAWQAAVFAVVAVVAAESALALTVRTKTDLRLWQTVMDRAAPLAWAWADGADAATLTFSNRLTRVETTVVIPRAPLAMRGTCAHPVPLETDEGLVAATLTQTAGGVAIARDVAELAYAPGVAGRTMTVRARSDRAWRRVPRPRLAGFDARWWGLEGPSGYEMIWETPPGWYRVERAFGGIGVVDEVLLFFGMPGFMMTVR